MNRTTEFRTYKSAFESFNPFEGMTVEELESFTPECDEDIQMLREVWDKLDYEIPSRYYTYEKVRAGGRTFNDLTGWTYPEWKIA